MAFKFGRNFILTVQTNSGEAAPTFLSATLPFTMEFDIVRNTLASVNTSTIRIYNLSEKNRNLIRKDVQAYWDIRTIELKAGYGKNLPIVFTGNIMQAWSVREGVDNITQIESFDGGDAFNNGDVSLSFPGGTPQQSIIDTLSSSLPGLSKGSIGNYAGTTTKGNSYVGNPAEILSQVTGGGFFVDNGKVNCLNDNETVPSSVKIINSQSGLLGTPVREQTRVIINMIFEPQIVAGQQIFLDSSTGKNFTGLYKVVGLKHSGTISPVVCGEAITQLTLISSNSLTDVQP